MEITEIPIDFFERDVRGWSIDPFPRGDSFSLYKNIHMVSLEPGAVRGNHTHLIQTEFLCVMGQQLLLASTSPQNEGVEFKEYNQLPIILKIPPKVTHAVKNTGSFPLYIFAFSDMEFNPNNRDVVKKIILS